MEPEFSKYTFEEFVDAEESIDREHHPERYKLIVDLIKAKSASAKTNVNEITDENLEQSDDAMRELFQEYRKSKYSFWKMFRGALIMFIAFHFMTYFEWKFNQKAISAVVVLIVCFSTMTRLVSAVSTFYTLQIHGKVSTQANIDTIGTFVTQLRATTRYKTTSTKKEFIIKSFFKLGLVLGLVLPSFLNYAVNFEQNSNDAEAESVLEIAQTGDAPAQFALARLIESGGLSRIFSPSDALHWYSLASQQQYAPAHLELGRIYEDGTLINKDLEKAKLFYQLAADSGIEGAHSLNLTFLFRQVSNQEDLKHAIEILFDTVSQDLYSSVAGVTFESITTFDSNDNNSELLINAQNGDANSAFRLAERYKSGREINKDIEQACYWYYQAIRLGLIDYYEELYQCITSDINMNIPLDNPEKLFAYIANANGYNIPSFIGEHYFLPHLVERDVNIAYRYFTIAAEDNDDIALNNLGVIYRDGLLGKPNLTQAHKYFERSANLGQVLAMHNLSLSFLNISGALARQEAFTWMEKSSNSREYPPSNFKLALFYLEGIGIDKNLRLANQLFLLAKDSGVSEATCFIVGIHLIQSELREDRIAGEKYLNNCPTQVTYEYQNPVVS